MFINPDQFPQVVHIELETKTYLTFWFLKIVSLVLCLFQKMVEKMFQRICNSNIKFLCMLLFLIKSNLTYLLPESLPWCNETVYDNVTDTIYNDILVLQTWYTFGITLMFLWLILYWFYIYFCHNHRRILLYKAYKAEFSLDIPVPQSNLPLTKPWCSCSSYILPWHTCSPK